MNKLLSGSFYIFFLLIVGIGNAIAGASSIGLAHHNSHTTHPTIAAPGHSLFAFGVKRGLEKKGNKNKQFPHPLYGAAEERVTQRSAGGVSCLRAAAQSTRETINFNTGWKFHMAYDVRKQPETINVTLPHTWNAQDVLSGKGNYQRESGIYEKSFTIDPAWKNKRLFLYFEGANSVATVLINKHFVTEHKGGYTAFCVEITGLVKPGETNQVEVQVSNAARTDVLPLCGDFNVYGGIHRPVSLLVTAKDCISPLDHGSPGVYLTPSSVSEQLATVNILTKLSVTASTGLQIRSEVIDAGQHVVASVTNAVSNNRNAAQTIRLKQPHLWNGKANPYVYTVQVNLLKDGQVIDRVTQPLGLRYYHVDANKGFILNGKYLDLHGVGFHEDVEGKGSALDTADYDEDMQLIKEIGATALRLTHYPHGKYFYDLCDRTGMVVWSEIPFVGPGGYTGAGYLKNPELEGQARQVLTEMIRQDYNHPSVCFWGLFNELKLDHDDPVPFIKELNTLAKKEDPTRLTTCATFLDGDRFNQVSDLIAWNKYYGWYDGEFKQIGVWADKTHHSYPQKAFAVSEYGAGGSPFKHSENNVKPDADGKFHPEEWQTSYHEMNWLELSKRPFIWGKFVWALADFGSSIRTEGDTSGINDKGLVTYDRKVKKDAFYFYKANWNPEPMLYITDRRNEVRTQQATVIKIYSTMAHVKLRVNGTVIANGEPDEFHIIRWENVLLHKGKNKIEVSATTDRKVLQDTCEWTMEDKNGITK
ncbi:glycoside hydrolase family 2 protein [Mucilaginibacter lappiensis]|uniref:Beta-galactosidase n=1 Tax=Mucilaginibacter lappiensis TaxID=354630 RepID=A0A841J7H6_9SPHI|nr:glycoside hydrolase family 2 TIM barrel-domain containing protein [Mucilaginibacter lappiensis]MBB6126312.1 beta-galactosidase [Mucilaginibacter lappiensis]